MQVQRFVVLGFLSCALAALSGNSSGVGCAVEQAGASELQAGQQQKCSSSSSNIME
jgi:hypothetical protein